MKSYKLLNWIIVLNVTFQLISDITAGKLIDVFGIPVSITILYFPFVYIFSDIITEVYGFAQARKVLWMTLAASVLAAAVYQLTVFLPGSSVFEVNDAYVIVFSLAPRVVLASWIAVFGGDMVNNYILARMKVWQEGRAPWFRFIASTVGGQFTNTVLFYVIALSGIIPANVIMISILAGWGLKVAVEAVMTPITVAVAKWVKSIEHEDHLDTDTNFNPFILKG